MDLSEFLETCADHIRAGGAFDFGDSPLYDPLASEKNRGRELGSPMHRCDASRSFQYEPAALLFVPPVYGGSDGEPKGSPVRASGARSSYPSEPPPLLGSHGDGFCKPHRLESNMATQPESNGTTTAVIPFNFNDNAVRAIDRDGTPWFSAADVCAALGVKNYRDSVAHLDEDERGVVSTDTPARNQHGLIAGQFEKMLVVNESGLYALVLRSRKPEARKFIKWVTSEVLPAIRKTGKYERPHNPAIDYDRISPAQAQDLKELVHAIADSKVQGFGETWARLHRKFRVNSYLELPATRFAEARDYLLAKLPEPPAAPIDAADAPALAAARKVAMDYFRAFHAAAASGQPAPRMDDIPQDVLEGLVADALLRQKMLVSFDCDTGHMQTKLVPNDASIISLQKGDYTGLVHSVPMQRLPELAEALNKRVASHLGAFSQHLQSNRPALGAM